VGAELPAINMHPTITAWGSPGNHDEGTAMLEIVHDLAPGAQLYFGGPDTGLEMKTVIEWMTAQGCDIIVDDLGFFDQGYFTDTTVANAASAAVAAGVTYVTAAGNFSDIHHWQGNFVQGLSAFGGGRLHQFGTPGQDVNTVNVPNGSQVRVFFQWSDDFAASANDYDLYLYDGDTIAQLDSSTFVQNGNDKPFESVYYTNNTGKTVHAQIWVVKKTGAAVREMELFVVGNSTMEFSTQGDAIFGHQAVAEVMSVAAANAAAPGTIAGYSSRGGSTIYTNFATQTKTTRQSLDGTAIDGVQNRVGQLGFFFNPFFGTSAAAPHAGAIAALVLQARNSLTPAQVLSTMAATATDLGVAGYDIHSGAGRYNALDAVYKVFTPAAPDLSAASDMGALNNDDLTNDTTPTFTGTVPLGSFVRLYIDGVQVGTQQLAAGVGTYSITSTPLTAGNHTATIRVASSGSITLANNSEVSTGLSFEIDTTKPQISNGFFNVDGQVQQIIYTFSEVMDGALQNGDLSLYNATTLANVPAANQLVAYSLGNSVIFSFPGYANGVLPDGNYTAKMDDLVVTDLAGNALQADHTFDFFFLQGDITRDRVVDSTDFTYLYVDFGQVGWPFTGGDLNYSGKVDFADFQILEARMGNTLLEPGSMLVSQPPVEALAKKSVFSFAQSIGKVVKKKVSKRFEWR
jgi:hypothetical protein